MKARIVLFLIPIFCLSVSVFSGLYAKPMPAGGPVVTKVACTEYQAAWMYSDGKVRSFIWNAKTGHVEFTPFDIGARKAVDVSTGFNRITILDDQGYVWLNNGGANTAVRWDKDATGAAFNGNVSIYGYFYTYMSIRNDGTIWYWGGDDYRFYGGTGVALPTKLNQPAGVKFVKLATGNVILGLTSTGDVYQWNKGSTSYVKVNLPRPASDVAASHNDFFVAVVPDNISASTMGYPYCWGSESKFWGGDGSSYGPSAPVSVKALWKMSSPIKKITANHNVIHYIDANGDLYGVGDNPNGEIGNGQEIVNHKEKYATPYAWSWAKYELLTGGPVHVSPGIKFKDIFTGNTFAFYHYALDVSDSLYFWGRNKSFVGGDGAVNNQEATYPNALDVLTPSRRTPMGVAPTQTVGYDFKMYTLNTLLPKQTVVLPLATLTAIATPTSLTAGGRANYGYSITKIQWTKVSGPSAYSITLPNSLITTVTGLTAGTYVFAVQTTDNNTGTITAYDTVVVNTLLPGVPVADAGGDQVITLPTSSATLKGTGTESGGTIASYKWTQTSGPSTAVFANAAAAQTVVSKLVQGSYVFKLTVTDSKGVAASATAKVTVNAAPVIITNPPVVNAGSDQSISLPTSSTTLLGSALATGGTISSYKWTQTSGPSTAVFANAAAAQTGVSGLIQGTYIFQLTATDNTGQQSSDALTVTVKAAPVTSTFVVSAGPDLTIGLPTSSVTIAGAATVKGETVSSCRWTQVSGPSTATIANGGSITPTVSKLVQGSYVFQVVLVSQSGKSSNDQVKVTVNAAPTGTFVVSAGPDLTISLPTSSVKIGGVATVKGETVNTCRWTQVSGPSTATISGGGSITPMVSKLVQGSYVFQVSLTSKSGISASDQVKVTVNAQVAAVSVDTAVAASAAVIASSTGTGGNLKLYPNPVAPDQQLTVEGSTGIEGTVRFTIYDISGKQVRQVVAENLLSSFRQTLSLNGLPRGVYMMTVQSGGKEKPAVLRFVIM